MNESFSSVPVEAGSVVSNTWHVYRSCQQAHYQSSLLLDKRQQQDE